MSTEFLGTRTDETGRPGNFIRFYAVPLALPGNYTGVEAYEGRVTFAKQSNESEVQALWNFEKSSTRSA